MNPITAFLVFGCLVAGLAVGYLFNPYLGFVFFVAAVLAGTRAVSDAARQTTRSPMQTVLLSASSVLWGGNGYDIFRR